MPKFKVLICLFALSLSTQPLHAKATLDLPDFSQVRPGADPSRFLQCFERLQDRYARAANKPTTSEMNLFLSTCQEAMATDRVQDGTSTETAELSPEKTAWCQSRFDAYLADHPTSVSLMNEQVYARYMWLCQM